MPLFPKTSAEWTRSVAYPLFGVCIVLLIGSTLASFGGDRLWKYAGASVGGVLLPSLGLSLGLTCFWGAELNKTFRMAAFIVAALSVFYAPMLTPALA
jgi:hypothetical protein